MSYFRVTGNGTQSGAPLERVTESAIEAEVYLYALTRACGKHGKVCIFGKDGRPIGLARLATLARAERAAEIGSPAQ